MNRDEKLQELANFLEGVIGQLKELRRKNSSIYSLDIETIPNPLVYGTDACGVVAREIMYRTINIMKDGKLFGRVVCATYPLNDSLTKFSVGLAYCSPKDNFNRKRGQEIALANLHNPEKVIEFNRPLNIPVFERLKDIIIGYGYDISWMRKVERDNLC